MTLRRLAALGLYLVYLASFFVVFPPGAFGNDAPPATANAPPSTGSAVATT